MKAVGEIIKAVAAGMQVEAIDCDKGKCGEDDKDGEDCEKASQYHLKAAGISSEHEFKQDFFGKRAPIKLWEICACKDGSIKLARTGMCGFRGPKVDTGYRWK